jgi:hypothetical protein
VAETFLLAVGVVALATAVVWWVVRRVRIWRTRALLRQVVRAHDRLRADVQVRHGSICTHVAGQAGWGEQKLADLEWVFAEVDQVLERRRLEDLAEVGRSLPAVAPPVVPIVLGGMGAVALVTAALMGS